MATTGGGAILNIGSVSADKPLSKVSLIRRPKRPSSTTRKT